MSANADDNFDVGLMNMLDMDFDCDDDGNPLPETDDDGNEIETLDEGHKTRFLYGDHR